MNTAASTRLLSELSMTDQVVPISIASVAIAKLTGKPAPNYRALWRMCVDGDISGIRRNGRWYLDVPQVAGELRLAKTPRAKAPKSAV
jgi:hypothetical protein